MCGPEWTSTLLFHTTAPHVRNLSRTFLHRALAYAFGNIVSERYFSQEKRELAFGVHFIFLFVWHVSCHIINAAHHRQVRRPHVVFWWSTPFTSNISQRNKSIDAI